LHGVFLDVFGRWQQREICSMFSSPFWKLKNHFLCHKKVSLHEMYPRPHFHAESDSCILWKNNMFVNLTVERLWGCGYVLIAELKSDRLQDNCKVVFEETLSLEKNTWGKILRLCFKTWASCDLGQDLI